MSELPVDYDDADEVFRTAELVLEQINLIYQEFSTSLPSRQFINVGGRGDTAHDCEQLSISIESVFTGSPGAPMGEPSTCHKAFTVSMIVELVRCIPTASGRGNKAPEAVEISNTGRVQARDAYLLINGANNAFEVQNFGGGTAEVFASAPQGGYQSVGLSIGMMVYAGDDD